MTGFSSSSEKVAVAVAKAIQSATRFCETARSRLAELHGMNEIRLIHYVPARRLEKACERLEQLIKQTKASLS